MNRYRNAIDILHNPTDQWKSDFQMVQGELAPNYPDASASVGTAGELVGAALEQTDPNEQYGTIIESLNSLVTAWRSLPAGSEKALVTQLIKSVHRLARPMFEGVVSVTPTWIKYALIAALGLISGWAVSRWARS